MAREIGRLPRGLETIHVRQAVDFVERETRELVDLYFEQANVFSAIVAIFGAKALDAISPYKRHKHPDVVQQLFPDPSLGGKLSPPPNLALESKGSTRPWAIQSHYDHPGWYIVWRYAVDSTETIKQGRPVVVWRVDVIFLEKADWKYEASRAGTAGGGRTHTFGLIRPAEKLANAAAFSLPGVAIKAGKLVTTEGNDVK